jgi:hypothetical protein
MHSIPRRNAENKQQEQIMSKSTSSKFAHFVVFAIVAAIAAVPPVVNAFDSTHAATTNAVQAQYGDAMYAAGLQMIMHKDASK